MFEFLFKYPGAVFQKGQFVLLASWPVWMLALGVAAAGGCTGMLPAGCTAAICAAIGRVGAA